MPPRSRRSTRFGQNVCRLRSAADLTQEALAESADISLRYVQALEAGNYNPTVEVASRLRKALHCTWDELCSGL